MVALRRGPDESIAVTLEDEPEGHALLFQDALELAGDLVVHARQDAVEEFDDLDGRAEPPPYRAKLEPDHAGTDHEELARHLFEQQRTGRRNDALLVDGRCP